MQNSRLCVSQYENTAFLQSLKSYADISLILRLDDFYLHSKLLNMALFRCYRCEVRYDIDWSVDFVKCLNCHAECCPRCEHERHPKKSCHQAYLNELERPRINQVNILATENIVIRCLCNPDRPLYKESECNKLKCPTCQKLWCWYCKVEIRDTKNPYNHFGLSKGLCALWDEPVALSDDLIPSTLSIRCNCDEAIQKEDGNLSSCKLCFRCKCKICEQDIDESNPYRHFKKFGAQCRMNGHPADDFLDSALAGSSAAQIEMGLIYQTGRDGVVISFEKAREWFQKACDGDDTELRNVAFYRMGHLWIERAASLYNAEAIKMLLAVFLSDSKKRADKSAEIHIAPPVLQPSSDGAHPQESFFGITNQLQPLLSIPPPVLSFQFGPTFSTTNSFGSLDQVPEFFGTSQTNEAPSAFSGFPIRGFKRK